MSQTSRGANGKGSKRSNVVHSQATYKPIPSRIGGPQPSGANASNFIPRTQQQLFLSNNCSLGSVSNSSMSGNNRLATLANVSVAAAAVASATSKNHHLSIANAPTSLANLARLGGITLLPITSSNDTRGNLSNLAIDLNLFNQNQPNGLPSNVNKSFIPISGTQGPISGNNNSKTEKSPFLANNNQWHVQKTSALLAQHDLESVPSVRFLNQASNMDAANLWVRTDSVGDPNAFTSTKNRTDSTTFPASTTTLTTGSNSSRAKKSRRNLNPKSSQPANNINHFVPDSKFSTFLNSMGAYQHQHLTETGGLLHNNISLTRSFDSSSTDHDLSNSSLMKLMAILNNPALTITAVNNSPSSASSYGIDSNVSSNFNTCSTRNLDRNDQPSTFSLNLTKQAKSSLQSEHMLGTDSVSSQIQSTSKGRVPQSATNLQLLLKTNTSQPTNKHQKLSQNTNQANSSNNLNSNATTLNNSATLNSNPYQLGWSADKTVPDKHHSSPPKPTNSDHSDITVQPKTFLSVMADNATFNHAGTEDRSRPNQTPTVSVQLLKHIASQAQDDDSDWMIEHDPDVVGRAVLEPECIITNARSLLPFSNEAKCVKVRSEVRVSCARKRHPKTVLLTSKKRLLVSNKIDSTTESSDNVGKDLFEDVQISIVTEPLGKEVFISEQHQMLSSMMADRGHRNFDDKANVSGIIPEPDDIFINRPKKVMSKIDTMLERKKRKRFERISGGSALKTNSIEEQCEESEAEWSDNDAEAQAQEKLGFVTLQLPLDDEELSSEKSEHLHSLGLVSRYERQKLSLQNLERQMNEMTPLAFEEPHEVSEDLKRMVDTILKTDGTDIQMRIDSNIKRNDLPLIEGLSRNTSKVKMSFMNVLGLEKRSKRTTLYKLKNAESTSSNASVTKQLDLKNQAIYPIMDQRTQTYSPYLSKSIHNSSASNNLQGQRYEQLQNQSEIKQHSQQQQRSQQQVYLNCRDVVKTSKNEYMKSLGLMAS